MNDETFPIVSVHMPKTAGTSFGQLLRDAFGTGLVAEEYTDDPANPISRYSMDPDFYVRNPIVSLGPYRAVHGHFSPRKYAHVPGAFRLTFLRHPIDNVTSIHRYWAALPGRQGENPLHTYTRDSRLNVVEVASLPRIRYLYSRTYFGDVDMRCFDFIGDYQNFEAELSRLEGLLGVLFERGVRVNVSSAHEAAMGVESMSSQQRDADVIGRLAELLREDIEFYFAHRGT